jgi:FMN-dependent NADH-azoreductase
MATLLHIDSSPRDQRSVSRLLTREFVDAWKTLNPGGSVIRRDLRDVPIPHIDNAWIEASKVAIHDRSPEEHKVLQLSDQLLSELEAADAVLIGVPMYNYTVPSSVKAYIDQIVRPGRTVDYSNGGFTGLLRGKVTTVITTSSGVFSEGGSGSDWNFLGPYLQKILGFVGLTDLEIIVADGLADTARRESRLLPVRERIRARVRAARGLKAASPAAVGF